MKAGSSPDQGTIGPRCLQHKTLDLARRVRYAGFPSIQQAVGTGVRSAGSPG
jgi:hypothetical protein